MLILLCEKKAGLGVETGNEAEKESLGMRLGSRDWKRGRGVETGNEAGK